jgi:hypothetical protein
MVLLILLAVLAGLGILAVRGRTADTRDQDYALGPVLAPRRRRAATQPN